MKRRTKSYAGSRPISTGALTRAIGGYQLDKESQNFIVGNVIPAGTLAKRDEVTRKVSIVKTAKVASIDNDNKKIVTLEVSDFCSPIFAIGDKVLKAISGTFAAAPSITAISDTESGYVITLSAEISGLEVGDILQGVVADGTNASVILANCVVVSDTMISEEEVIVDVCVDTMQYAIYERRILPVASSQKTDDNFHLKGNPHIRFTFQQ